MTDKLKCPFCGEEIKIAGERTTIMSCFNGECYGSGLYGEEAMWQALIDGKKAQDALKVAEDCLSEISNNYEISDYCSQFISRTFDRITSITKQEK